MTPLALSLPASGCASITELLNQKTIWCGDSSRLSTPESSFLTTDSEAALRQAIPFGIPEIDSILPNEGLERGLLHELVYNDSLQPKAISKILPVVLAYNAHIKLLESLKGSFSLGSPKQSNSVPIVAWIGRECWPTPFSLAMLSEGSEHYYPTLISRSLFINPQNNKSLLWAIETALRSKAIDIVVAVCPHVSRVTTQRLALAAKNNRTTALLLRSARDLSTPSCAASRWELQPIATREPVPSWRITLHKIKGTPLYQKSWHICINESYPGLGTTLSAQQRILIKNIDSRSYEDAPLLQAAARS